MKPYVEVPVYSLCALIGVIVSAYIVYLRLPKYGYNRRIILLFAVFSLGFMALGAKLLFFITQFPKVFTDFSIHKFIHTFVVSGFVYYGGVYGALLGTLLVAKILGLNNQKLCNFAAPIFALFHGIGRVGCFFGGCCYGIPWSHGIAMAEDPGVPRFPVQLLEAAGEICIFVLLLCLDRKDKKRNLMWIYFFVYAVMRFGTEFLRGDLIRGIWFGGLSTSQIIALLTIIGCIIYIILTKRRKNTISIA